MGKILDLAINVSMLMSGDLTTKIAPAVKGLENLRQKTQSLQQLSGKISGFQRQAESLQTLSAKLYAAKEKTAELTRQKELAGNTDRKLNAEYDKALKAEQRLSDAYDRQRAKLEELRRALREAGLNTERLGTEQRELQRRLDETTRAQKRLADANNRYGQLKESLSWNSIKGEVLTTIGTFSALQAPVKIAADFEAAMARVKSVGFSKEDADMTLFEEMKAQAKQLGADTQFTAIEAAGAQENLIRSGMTPEMVMQAMPSVLNMAAAEGMSIETAGSIIAKGLGGMNLEGNLAPRLADILAYTSASSNTNIAMLGEAFKVAAPVMASQGYAMEQVATYLGVLANKGFEGSEAGNALSSSIQRLAALPKEGLDALKSLGIERRDKDGKALDLPELMMRLNYRLKDKSENVQLEYLSTIFGKNYGKQMIAFMQATASGQTKKMAHGIWLDSFGHAQKMADINLDTLNGQLQILGSAWDGVKTTIGEMFTPIVRTGVEVLSSSLSWLNTTLKEFPVASETIVYTLAAIAGSKAAISLWNIGSALVQLPGAWLEVHRAASAAGEAIGFFPTIIVKISDAFTALGSLIMAHPIVTLGVLVASAVSLAIANWEKLKSWWNSWNPAPKTALELKQIAADKKAVIEKYGTADFRPSYMKTAAPSALTAPAPIVKAPSSGAVKAHAAGGILTQPHIGLVAEAGPEAIIPLSKPSLGVPILEKAASILGMRVNTQEKTKNSSNQFSRVLNDLGISESSYSVMKAGDSFEQHRTISSIGVRNVSSSADSVQHGPVINITVYGAAQEPQSLAEDIAAKVREVLREISSLEERVSYA